jgi:hypothetical protein
MDQGCLDAIKQQKGVKMSSPHRNLAHHAIDSTTPACEASPNMETLQRLLLDIECAMAACEDAGCAQWADTLRFWAKTVADALHQDLPAFECRSPEIWLG